MRMRGAIPIAAAQDGSVQTSATFYYHPGAVTALLGRGEIEASAIDCKPWDAEKFKNALSKIEL